MPDRRDDETTGTEVTQILQNWANETKDARGRVVEAMYEELRKNAQRHLRREHQMQELQPTLLVNEAYLRLVKASNVDLQGRTHFLGLAGRIMRQILVDEARRFNAGKRDRALQTRLTGEYESDTPAVHDIIELSELLDGLEQVDPVYVQIFEARAFAGMTFDECASALKVSVSSVKRKWKIALAWLKEQELENHRQSAADGKDGDA